MGDQTGQLLGGLVVGIVVSFLVFLILRELMCWYYKINRIVSLLEDIKAALPHEGAVPRAGRDAQQAGRTADGTTLGLGNVERPSGSTEGALESEPGEVEPKYPADLYNKGVDLLESGKPAEAIELFDEAIEAGLHDSDTMFWKGECLLRLGACERALMCFERAAALDSSDPKPLYGKARALDKLGRTEKAAKFYSGYLAKAPKDDEWTDVARRRLEEIERAGGH